MKWKKRERELARLRKKHPAVARPPVQSLTSASARYPSLSETGVSKICFTRQQRTLIISPEFFVGTPHKQGPMVMFRDELPQGGGKKT